jgi:hypothetical protein
MRKHSVLVLAAAVALLAAPAFASAPAGQELICPANATADAPDLVPADPEAAPAEADLEIEEAMIPEPTPAFCPSDRRCTFFCPEFEKCPNWDCIGGWCVYW